MKEQESTLHLLPWMIDLLTHQRIIDRTTHRSKAASRESSPLGITLERGPAVVIYLVNRTRDERGREPRRPPM